MRVGSLPVYPPAVSRWLPVMAIVAFSILVFIAGTFPLAFAGSGAPAPLLTLVPDGSVQPFRW